MSSIRLPNTPAYRHSINWESEIKIPACYSSVDATAIQLKGLADQGCSYCSPRRLHIVLQSIATIRSQQKLQSQLQNAVELSFRYIEELSPAHLCATITTAGNLDLNLTYRKLQVRLLGLVPCPNTSLHILHTSTTSDAGTTFNHRQDSRQENICARSFTGAWLPCNAEAGCASGGQRPSSGVCALSDWLAQWMHWVRIAAPWAFECCCPGFVLTDGDGRVSHSCTQFILGNSIVSCCSLRDYITTCCIVCQG